MRTLVCAPEAPLAGLLSVLLQVGGVLPYLLLSDVHQHVDSSQHQCAKYGCALSLDDIYRLYLLWWSVSWMRACAVFLGQVAVLWQLLQSAA